MTQENWLDHQMTMQAESHKAYEPLDDWNGPDWRDGLDPRERCCDDEEEEDPVDRYPGWGPSV